MHYRECTSISRMDAIMLRNAHTDTDICLTMTFFQCFQRLSSDRSQSLLYSWIYTFTSSVSCVRIIVESICLKPHWNPSCILRCLRYHFGSMVVGGLVVGFCQPFRLALGSIAFILQFQGSCSCLILGDAL